MEHGTLKTRILGNRHRVMVIALIVLVAALIAGGTLAYFTDEETAYNVITTGNLDMMLHEETTDSKPFPKEGISGVMPGDVVDKKVYLSNEGNVDMYVRIGVETTIEPETLSLEYISLDINTADWTEKDGYYYYTKALKPGEATPALFNTVTFSPDMGNDYQECTVKVDVKAQAVQAKNNTDSALTAGGCAE